MGIELGQEMNVEVRFQISVWSNAMKEAVASKLQE